MANERSKFSLVLCLVKLCWEMRLSQSRTFVIQKIFRPTMVGKEKERGKERGEGDAIKNRYAQKNSGYGAATSSLISLYDVLALSSTSFLIKTFMSLHSMPSKVSFRNGSIGESVWNGTR